MSAGPHWDWKMPLYIGRTEDIRKDYLDGITTTLIFVQVNRVRNTADATERSISAEFERMNYDQIELLMICTIHANVNLPNDTKYKTKPARGHDPKKYKRMNKISSRLNANH